MPAPDELIGDVERQQEIERLRQCTSDGRLTLDEFAERVGEVYAARTWAELTRPTADLPALAAAPPLIERTSAIGVFSGARQCGRWRPAQSFDAVAVFGSAQIDHRRWDRDPGPRGRARGPRRLRGLRQP